MRQYLVGFGVLVTLAGVAGCSHYLFAEREPWRHDAEVSCLNSGVANAIPGRVRISAIEGPGICGIDYPLKVSELGENAPLSYDDSPLRPPGSIPAPYSPIPQPRDRAVPQPAGAGVESTTLPPLGGGPPFSPATPAPYPASPGQPLDHADGAAQPGAPISLTPPGLAQRSESTPPPGAANPDAPLVPPVDVPDRLYSPRPLTSDMGGAPPAPPASAAPAAPSPLPPLGPPAAPIAAGPVAVRPAATLACPIVSVLDRWIATGVQPAALKWFGEPVVEIKQISAYSCRGMNGNPNAHISEHAFGNALDIAEFDLADGHRITVQHGWHGTPEEQGFLHDVQGAACRDFTTVLAPGANVYHYNHIHVDLMRRRGRPYICEPTAIPGEVAAARARARYAAQHGYSGVTGSIRARKPGGSLGYSGGDDDDRLPLAVPGED